MNTIATGHVSKNTNFSAFSVFDVWVAILLGGTARNSENTNFSVFSAFDIWLAILFVGLATTLKTLTSPFVVLLTPG